MNSWIKPASRVRAQVASEAEKLRESLIKQTPSYFMSTSPTLSEALADSVVPVVAEGVSEEAVTKFLTEHGPDACDAICGIWGSVIPAVAEEILCMMETPGAEAINSPAFNFVDSFAAIVQGCRQLTDKKNHRPDVTKFKGGVNIVSGATLAGITGHAMVAGGALGAITAVAASNLALSAMIGISFAWACDELACAVRRRIDAEYWLMDNLKQLDKLNTVLIPNLKTEIDNTPKNGRAYDWIVEHKKKRLKLLELSAAKLNNDIRTRIQSNDDCNKYFNEHCNDPLFYNNIHFPTTPTMFSPEKAKKWEEKFKSECDSNIQKSIQNCLYVGILFTGTLLLSLTATSLFCIPGGQLAGTILLGVFAAWFTAKNVKSLAETSVKAYHGVKTLFAGDEKSKTKGAGQEDRIDYKSQGRLSFNHA